MNSIFPKSRRISLKARKKKPSSQPSTFIVPNSNVEIHVGENCSVKISNVGPKGKVKLDIASSPVKQTSITQFLSPIKKSPSSKGCSNNGSLTEPAIPKPQSSIEPSTLAKLSKQGVVINKITTDSQKFTVDSSQLPKSPVKEVKPASQSPKKVNIIKSAESKQGVFINKITTDSQKVTADSSRLSKSPVKKVKPTCKSPKKMKIMKSAESKQGVFINKITTDSQKLTADSSRLSKSPVKKVKPHYLSELQEELTHSSSKILLSPQVKRSPTKFFVKSKNSSPKPSRKRKLFDESERLPNSQQKIPSIFASLSQSSNMCSQESYSAMDLNTQISDSDDCFIVEETLVSSCSNVSDGLAKVDAVRKELSVLSSVPWDEPFKDSDSQPAPEPTPAQTSLPPAESIALNSFHGATNSNNNCTPSKSHISENQAKSHSKLKSPTTEKNFEMFIYYLIYNPVSAQASENILSHPDMISLFLSFSKLSNEAQLIYGRIYSRTKTWYRLENDLVKNYSCKVNDITGVLSVLEKEKLLSKDISGESLECLLNLLSLDELKKIGKQFNIPNTSVKKKDLIQSLLKCGSRQKSLSKISTSDLILKSACVELGQCWRLTENPSNTFYVLLILATFPFYRGEEKDRLNYLINLLNLTRSRQIVFPSYEVIAIKVFDSFDHLKEFAEANRISGDLSSLIEKKEKEQASDLILKIQEKFIDYLKRIENREILMPQKKYLVKFTAGNVYAYCLNLGVKILKSCKMYKEAETVLLLLLRQQHFMAGAKGSWFNELALIYETQFKDIIKAAHFVIEGLTDDRVSLIHRTTLAQRGMKLLQRKKPSLNNADLAKMNAAIARQTQYKPESVVIQARSILGGPGKKQVFVRDVYDGKQISSVEELVIEHFRSDAEKTYQKGIHDEGRSLVNLGIACFYNIIYSQPVPGESFFLCHFQTRPLDWGTRSFYERRKNLIDTQLTNLRLGGLTAVMEHLSDICVNVFNVESLVDWNYLSIENLPKIKELLECINVNVFLNIAEHVIKDYKAYRSGLPDLLLWDPATKESLFVEVKGPNDSLSITQTIWLENLNKFGAKAIVCHVETIGSTKRRVDLGSNHSTQE